MQLTLILCSLRCTAQVPEHRSGVIIVKLDPLASAAAVLKENDVVLEVG